MRVALKQKTPAPTTPRAREREALHELDDGRLVLEHLAGDAQAFGALVDRYQTRLLNFINRTIGDRKRYLKEAVDQCVGQLPTHHRAVFVLRELEGKSYAEIADITGCNLGTVKSRLNRARNSFAQLIEPLLE